MSVTGILYVATSEYTRNVRLGSTWIYYNITIGIGRNLTTQESGIRRMTNSDKHAVRFDEFFKPCIIVANRQALNSRLAGCYFKRCTVKCPRNLTVIACAVLHNF
ncbi:hypothetical protein D3C71_1824380 [compost metagenome]